MIIDQYKLSQRRERVKEKTHLLPLLLDDSLSPPPLLLLLLPPLNLLRPRQPDPLSLQLLPELLLLQLSLQIQDPLGFMRRDDGVLLSRRRCRGIRSRRVELIQRLSELGEKTLLVGLDRVEGERLGWLVRGGRRLLMVVRVSRRMVRRRGRKGVELEGVEGSLLLLLLLRREA